MRRDQLARAAGRCRRLRGRSRYAHRPRPQHTAPPPALNSAAAAPAHARWPASRSAAGVSGRYACAMWAAARAAANTRGGTGRRRPERMPSEFFLQVQPAVGACGRPSPPRRGVRRLLCTERQCCTLCAAIRVSLPPGRGGSTHTLTHLSPTIAHQPVGWCCGRRAARNRRAAALAAGLTGGLSARTGAVEAQWRQNGPGAAHRCRARMGNEAARLPPQPATYVDIHPRFRSLQQRLRLASCRGYAFRLARVTSGIFEFFNEYWSLNSARLKMCFTCCRWRHSPPTFLLQLGFRLSHGCTPEIWL